MPVDPYYLDRGVSPYEKGLATSPSTQPSPAGTGPLLAQAGGKGATPAKPSPTLVALSVVEGTRIGDSKWATIRKGGAGIVIEAKTSPDGLDVWRRIKWSGAGERVADKPNQRRLSRAKSKKYRVVASLGGREQHVDVWVLWATITILTKGNAPANAARWTKELAAYGKPADGTDKLGAIPFNNGREAVGKIVAVATITPKGIHDVVKDDWGFRRAKEGTIWTDAGTPEQHSAGWPRWTDDQSPEEAQKLTPDADDKIYDTDAPSEGLTSMWNESQRYINFRQWVEWNGERCSDFALWYWKARWQRGATPEEITLKEVGLGNIPIPSAPAR